MKSTPTLAERILALPCLGTMSQFATLDDLKLYQSAFKEGLAQAAAMAEQAAVKLPVKPWHERQKLSGVDTMSYMQDEIDDLRAALAEQEPVVTPEMIAKTRQIAEGTLAISEALDKLRAKYGLAEQEGQEAVAWISTNTVSGNKHLGYGKVTSSHDATLYSHQPLYAHRSAQEGDAKWVSVNDERKPEPGQVILVYAFSLTHGEDDEGNYRANETEEVAMGEYRRTTANGTDYHFDCFTFPNGDVDSISHWMPLPDAPVSTTTPKG